MIHLHRKLFDIFKSCYFGKVTIMNLSGIKYKSFHETYTVCSYALIVSMLYPNSATLRIRWITNSIIFSSILPIYAAFLVYVIKCFASADLTNLNKQYTIGIIALLHLFKIFYIIARSKEYGYLVETMNNDLAKANFLNQSYKDIYDEYIKVAKYGQFCWIVNCIGMLTAMILTSAGKMLYAYLMDSNQKKYMIHEMEFKYFEDKQYDSPYFEFIWLYMTFVCSLFTSTFIGIDGTFCIFTTHTALKMKLVAHKLRKAFDESKDVNGLRNNIKSAIEDHQKALSYYNLTQSLHSNWLFLVFALTSVAISLNLYQVVEGSGVETKYAMISICCIVHSYIPCYFGSILREVRSQLFTFTIHNYSNRIK